MKYLKSYLVLALFFPIFSCGNDDDSPSLDATEIDMVTGIIAVQNEFDSGLQLGNPNIYLEGGLVTYPNPAIDVLTISQVFNSYAITDIWFVKSNATRRFQDMDFDAVFENKTYSDSEIISVAENAFNDLETMNFSINLENFEAGYYRVFVKINNEIQWNNVYIDPNGTAMDIQDLIDYWN